MAVYTYIGNKVPSDTTDRLVLRGGDLVLPMWSWADLTSPEFTDLSGSYWLVPGQVGNATPPSRILATLAQIDSTSLTTAGIDALFNSPPPDGTFLSDPTNHRLLIRQGGAWYKTAVLTAV